MIVNYILQHFTVLHRRVTGLLPRRDTPVSLELPSPWILVEFHCGRQCFRSPTLRKSSRTLNPGYLSQECLFLTRKLGSFRARKLCDILSLKEPLDQILRLVVVSWNFVHWISVDDYFHTRRIMVSVKIPETAIILEVNRFAAKPANLTFGVLG